MLKTTVFQSIAKSSDGIPKDRDFATMPHVCDQLAKSGWITRHFQADVETFGHTECPLRVFDVFVRTSITRVAPIFDASSSRQGLTSVTAT